jgi:hypothetical protein
MIKSIVKSIDSLLFDHALQLRLRARMLGKKTARIDSNSDQSFVIYTKKNTSDPLLQLCDKYGSDKGEVRTGPHPYPWPSHNYADFYSRLFSHCRLGVTKVMECGLGTNNPDIVSSMGADGKPGASLRVWRDYFPNAIVIGADIDREILFEEDRIKTYYLDQTNPQAIAEFWQNVGLEGFDVILDDGLHIFEAGVCLFENSISKLAKNGVYIIEDVFVDDLLRFQDFFRTQQYAVDYVNLRRPGIELTYNNNLVVIRHLGS